MVEAERVNGCDGSEEEPEQEVEAVMSEIRVPRGGDVDGGEQGNGNGYEEVEGWGGGLVACCDYGVFCD